MPVKQVLIVDDSFEMGRVLQSALLTIDRSWKIVLVPSAEEAMLETSTGKLDLMISDIHLPGISGIELVKKIRERQQTMKVIMITGLTDSKIEKEARLAGADFFLRKPIDMSLFLDTVTSLLGLVDEPLPVKDKPKKTSVLDASLIQTGAAIQADDAKTLSVLIQTLNTDLGGRCTFMLNERGNIAVQAGDLPEEKFAENWGPSILSVISTVEKVSRKMTQAPSDNVIALRGEKFNLLLSAVADFTLVVVLPSGKRSVRMALAIEEIQLCHTRLLETMQGLGMVREPVVSDTLRSIPDNMADLPADELITAVDSQTEEERALAYFESLLSKKAAIKPDDLDAFWDAAARTVLVDLNNSDMITFEQAEKLGLTPQGD